MDFNEAISQSPTGVTIASMLTGLRKDHGYT
jgi:hypothetical protein